MLDIGILMGGPYSQLYNQQRNLIKEVIANYDISSTAVQVGVVTYGQSAMLQIPLNKHKIKKGLQSELSFIKPGAPGNNFNGGLGVVLSDLFSTNYGARKLAAKRLLVFVTDQVNVDQNIAQKVKDSGVEIIVLTVGLPPDSNKVKELVDDVNNIVTTDPVDVDGTVTEVLEKLNPGVSLVYGF